MLVSTGQSGMCCPHARTVGPRATLHSLQPGTNRAFRFSAKAYKADPATSQQSSDITSSGAAHVHNGRFPFWQLFEELKTPFTYQLKVLQGHKFAWGRSLMKGADMLFVADADYARGLLRNENELGIRTDFPEAIKQLLGTSSLIMTQDPALHAHIRQVMSPYFTAEAIQRLMPDIHATVQKHMARWAASSKESPIDAYVACKTLTFDVMVNQAVQIGMNDSEVVEYAKIFAVWIGGFMPPPIDLPIFPYGRALKARRQLIVRSLQALKDPELPPGSLTARLRDEFGPESDVAVDSMINVLFAGHDTTSSAITFLLWQLGRHPEVVSRLRAEQTAVQQKYGSELSPAALGAMPYTVATAKETVRLARIIVGLFRKTTKPIEGLSRNRPAPSIPSGCPFFVATGAISVADPALLDDPDSEEFKPERWLDPKAAKSMAANQLPFGYGQHFCLGAHLATAELTAASTVLARGYELAADADVTWVDFPIKKPSNFFGVQLTPL